MAKSPSQGRSPPTKTLRLLTDHQRWLNSQGRFGKRLEQDELEFVDCDIDGIDLSGAELRYAFFDGGSIKMGRFVGANLYKATFDSCNIEGADFSSADLRWATFRTNHDQARFTDAKTDHTAWHAEDEKRNEAEHRKTRFDFFTHLRRPRPS